MNDYSHGIQGDANSSALLTHQQRQDKADMAYEEREANAPADLYEDEAREMIIEALTGGKDDIDIIGCLAHRFEKNNSVGAFMGDGLNYGSLIVATPDHLVRQIQWAIQDQIKHWVDFQTKKYAEEIL